MKILFLGFCLLCLSARRVQSKPQITKLFPVQELVEYHQQSSNEVKPLDKFLGKLRATYDLVFRKPENTSNVERILAKDAPNPDLQALKSIWTVNQAQGDMGNKPRVLEGPNEILFKDENLSIDRRDWINSIKPLDNVEPLAPLELQDEDDGENEGGIKGHDVENVTPNTGLQLPITLSRQLVEWLGSLLGLTYGVYSKLARAIHSN